MNSKKATVLLINNAYPSELHPKRGAYIKTIEGCLLEANLSVDKIILKTDYSSFFQKVWAYLRFYLDLLNFKYFDSYDYIYIHHFPNMFIPLIPKFRSMKKVVINFHGGDVVATKGFAKIMNAFSYHFMSPDFCYIVPSAYFKEKVFARIPKLREARFFVSPSGGIDMRIFKPKQEKAEKEGKLRIGFASGLDYSKGAEDLIRLMERFNVLKYEFHIIDYGKHRQKYINKIESMPNVVLYKTFKKNEMPIFYSKIDVLFFPSKSESLGLVALEAISCNVPVIGPDDFALKDIIQSKITGEKYNPDKEEGYVEALEKFMAWQEDYKPRQIIYASYSKEYVVEQFKEIFS